jgi:hypothetical protein
MKHLQLYCIIAVASLLSQTLAYSQESLSEVIAVTTSENSNGNTEASMNNAALKFLEKSVVEGVTKKTMAALSGRGFTEKFPPFLSTAGYVSIGGKKLAIVKLRNKYANQVVVHGFVGQEFRRVFCAKTKNMQEDVPVFYGNCGETVRSTFALKGVP